VLGGAGGERRQGERLGPGARHLGLLHSPGQQQRLGGMRREGGQHPCQQEEGGDLGLGVGPAQLAAASDDANDTSRSVAKLSPIVSRLGCGSGWA